MELEPLSCDNCGAPLEVPPTANYVTCAHCSSRLAVTRTESAHYTEVLERLNSLDTRTDDIEAEVARLRTQDAIRNLDESWESERQQYLVRSREGPVEPSLARVAFYAFFVTLMVVLFCAWTIAAPINRTVGGMLLVIILLVGGTVGWLAVSEYLKYANYKAAESVYLARHDELVNEGWQIQRQRVPAPEVRGVESETGTGRE